jgi:hypothetical protein
MSKPKPPFRWPEPGEPWKFVPDAAACDRGGFSQAHLNRLADAPPVFVVGERMRRRRSDHWDAWFASRPKAKAPKPVPAEPPPAEEGRPRKRLPRRAAAPIAPAAE